MKIFPRLRGIGSQEKGKFLAAIPSVGSLYCDGVLEKNGLVTFYRYDPDNEVYFHTLITVSSNTSWSMIDMGLLDLITEADLYDEAEDQASRMNILRRRLTEEGGDYMGES